MTAATLAAVSFVDWTWALNLSSPELGREAGGMIAAICLCIAAATPPTVFRQARLGLLHGARVNLWDFAGLVAGFAGLFFATWAGFGLVAIAVIWAGAPVLARTAGAAAFLIGSGRDLRPSPRYIETAASRDLLSSGSVFVFYSVTQLLALQSAPVLIARFLGTAAVADFSVVQRLFQQPQVLIWIVLVAQWPAYAEAYGRGDMSWIERHLKQSLLWYTVFAAFSYGLLGVFCTPILRVWVGSAITVPEFLVPAMVLSGIVTAAASVFSFFYSVARKTPSARHGQICIRCHRPSAVGVADSAHRLRRRRASWQRRFPCRNRPAWNSCCLTACFPERTGRPLRMRTRPVCSRSRIRKKWSSISVPANSPRAYAESGRRTVRLTGTPVRA